MPIMGIPLKFLPKSYLLTDQPDTTPRKSAGYTTLRDALKPNLLGASNGSNGPVPIIVPGSKRKKKDKLKL